MIKTARTTLLIISPIVRLLCFGSVFVVISLDYRTYIRPSLTGGDRVTAPFVSVRTRESRTCPWPSVTLLRLESAKAAHTAERVCRCVTIRAGPLETFDHVLAVIALIDTHFSDRIHACQYREWVWEVPRRSSRKQKEAGTSRLFLEKDTHRVLPGALNRSL